MHTVAILALDNTVALDLAIPCDLFSRVRVPGVERPYEVRVCGERAAMHCSGFELTAPYGLGHLASADTIVVPGLSDARLPVSEQVIRALRDAAANGARIASICSGAFVLASTGLLDGLRATTHWLAAAELARRYPAIEVDPNVLFIDNGKILTSAGATAGFDLCLHMVRCDYGAAAAADSARLAVMALERQGGQAQFIVRESDSPSTALQPLLVWMERNLSQPLSLTAMAQYANMSTRTLSRRFLEQIGTTPAQWLLGARVRHAQQLLETTDFSMERVAAKAGFGSSQAMRERFMLTLGIAPVQYRLSFRTPGLRSPA